MTQLATPFPDPDKTTIDTEVFGAKATVYIADYHYAKPFGDYGGDDSVVVEFCLPDWSGRRTRAEALEGIAALRTLLASAEAALRANDAPESDGQ
jgi:hypothetical protein